MEMFALSVWTWIQSFFFIFFKAFRYDVLLFNPEIKLDSRYMFNIFDEKREKNREKLCSTAVEKKRVKELENGKSKASICCMWCGACIWRKKEEETSGFVILIYLICTSLFTSKYLLFIRAAKDYFLYFHGKRKSFFFSILSLYSSSMLLLHRLPFLLKCDLPTTSQQSF